MNECVGIFCLLVCVCVRSQTHRAFTYLLSNYSKLEANCLGKASIVNANYNIIWVRQLFTYIEIKSVIP